MGLRPLHLRLVGAMAAASSCSREDDAAQRPDFGGPPVYRERCATCPVCGVFALRGVARTWRTADLGGDEDANFKRRYW